MTTEAQSPPAGDWMQIIGGGQLWLLRPDPALITIDEIATCLARTPRFTGHTKERFPADGAGGYWELLHGYSVAQHSVLVSQLCPMFMVAGLLHDAHEAYSGDMSTPMKRTLQALLGDAFKVAWDKIIRRLDMAIAEALYIDKWHAGDFHAPEVKHADLIALATEKRDLMAPEPAPWRLTGIEPAAETIIPLPAAEARKLFLDRYYELAHWAKRPE